MGGDLIRAGERLLEAFHALGEGWHTRKDLAHALGRKAINGTDVVVLDFLVMQGKIEEICEPIGYTEVRQWKYRLSRGVKP